MLKLDFTDQVVLLTGAGSGIGLTTARLFSQAGAKVVCLDIQPPAHAIAGMRFVEADVSSFEGIGACIQATLAQEKTIHCLVNNAGISRDAPVWKMTEKDWDAVLSVNLKGAFNCIHHLAPHFRQQKSGKIVNISSINGLRGKFGLANYAASKAGLVGLTKTVAKELGRFNINVNAVAPGYVMTPLTDKLPEKIIDEARSETVLGRLGDPEDVANAIVFLCSDLARHITGEVIKVDGGQYI